MRHYTYFEAMDDLYLLPLSFPQSSRSFRGREELPSIFQFNQIQKLFKDLFLQEEMGEREEAEFSALHLSVLVAID